MSLHSPVEFAQIVDSYIDGYRKNGWMPECRSNNLPGWTQGGKIYPSPICLETDLPMPGSSADNIVSHFAVNYHNEAEALGIDLAELYAALKADGEDNPLEWNTKGRQVNVYQCVSYS
jgi:hypothetical protein